MIQREGSMRPTNVTGEIWCGIATADGGAIEVFFQHRTKHVENKQHSDTIISEPQRAQGLYEQ